MRDIDKCRAWVYDRWYKLLPGGEYQDNWKMVEVQTIYFTTQRLRGSYPKPDAPLRKDGKVAMDSSEFFMGEDAVLMRCTGMKDKNGKLIYESDIVLTDEAGWIAQVIWDRDCFMCIKKNSGFSSMCNWEDFEVLGNIYEHPERLEGEPVYPGYDRKEMMKQTPKDYTHFKDGSHVHVLSPKTIDGVIPDDIKNYGKEASGQSN